MSNITSPVDTILQDPHHVDLDNEHFADTRTLAKVLAKSVRLDEQGVVTAVERAQATAEHANTLQDRRAALSLHN